MSDVEILGQGTAGIIYREGGKLYKISKRGSSLENEYKISKIIHNSYESKVEEVKKYFMEIKGFDKVKYNSLPSEIKEAIKKGINIQKKDIYDRLEIEQIRGESFLKIIYRLLEHEIEEIFKHILAELPSGGKINYHFYRKFENYEYVFPKEKIKKINCLFLLVINKILKA